MEFEIDRVVEVRCPRYGMTPHLVWEELVEIGLFLVGGKIVRILLDQVGGDLRDLLGAEA